MNERMTYRDVVATRFGGTLTSGKHAPDGMACALEAVAVTKGLHWTDDPRVVGLPDLRPLNDAMWSSDAARTAGLMPVVEALWDWSTWSTSRCQEWIKRVVIETVRDIVSAVVPEPHATTCRTVTTLIKGKGASAATAAASAAATAAASASASPAYDAATAAASAVAAYDAATAAAYAAAAYDAATAAAYAASAAYAAAYAAYAAAYAAYAAVAAAYDAVAAAAADALLTTACRIWIEAAEATRENPPTKEDI